MYVYNQGFFVKCFLQKLISFLLKLTKTMFNLAGAGGIFSTKIYSKMFLGQILVEKIPPSQIKRLTIFFPKKLKFFHANCIFF